MPWRRLAMSTLSSLIRRLACRPDASDAVLLGRFQRDRDESAFTALVCRHGPMVLRICRRVLRDAHLAEAAFQATFLVLARQAGTIRRPESLACWLHGVALRLASRARATRPVGTTSATLAPCDPHPDPLAEV